MKSVIKSCRRYYFDTNDLEPGERKYILFADDTTVALTGWFDANKFLINEDKTVRIVVSLRVCKKKAVSVHFLGVLVDPTLNESSMLIIFQ